MKTVLRLITSLILCGVFLIGCQHRVRSGKPRILIFTKTADFHPASIPAGVAAIIKLGSDHDFETDTTSDASRFTEDSLRPYAAVIFLDSTGNLLNNYQEADFERFIQAGGGFVDIHGATDAEHGRHHDFDGGRAWYTDMGHTEESWSDSLYLQHILAGIQYAIGKNNVPDYSKAQSLRVPEENRFTKTMLVEGRLSEPTEMTILPNLDVLIAQRRGEVLLYKNASRQLQSAGSLNVYYKALTPTESTEEGLLGIRADPDFASNHFVYLYYTPTDTPGDRLSRFTMKQDSLDPTSEKIILRTRPEIVMGNRNSYRISINKKNGKAGNFGWPDFAGNNYAGGTTAMAGPVYYTGLFPDSTRYPDYYTNKLFIYDRGRGWIKAVTMFYNGDFDKMEPFMAHTAFNAPIDIETGPDGRIYVLEYGHGWYQQNPDGGLAVIRYNAGNRPPEISSLKTARTAGLLPFKGIVQVIARDPENDPLSYSWNFGNGVIKETTIPEAEFNYTSAGDYRISVEVKDDHGATTTSKPLVVYAGIREQHKTTERQFKQ